MNYEITFIFNDDKNHQTTCGLKSNNQICEKELGSDNFTGVYFLNGLEVIMKLIGPILFYLTGLTIFYPINFISQNFKKIFAEFDLYEGL